MREFIIAVSSAVAASILTLMLVGGWKQIAAIWTTKERRCKLIQQLRTDVANMMHNVPHYLDINPQNHFPLVHPQTGCVIEDTQRRILDFVGKVESSIMDEMYMLTGLFSFSKRQQALLREVTVRLSTFGASVAYYGTNVSKGTGVPQLTEDAAERIDITHVQERFGSLHALFDDKKPDCIWPKLRLRYRFFPLAITFDHAYSRTSNTAA